MIFWLNTISLIVVGFSLKFIAGGISRQLGNMFESDARLNLLHQISYMGKVVWFIAAVITVQMVYVHIAKQVSIKRTWPLLIPVLIFVFYGLQS